MPVCVLFHFPRLRIQYWTIKLWRDATWRGAWNIPGTPLVWGHAEVAVSMIQDRMPLAPDTKGGSGMLQPTQRIVGAKASSTRPKHIRMA
jgi:hypothetical protein